MIKTTTIRKSLDIIGFSASFFCAIHCALVPIIVSVGALSALSFLTHPLIEPLVLFISFCIAISSLIPSYMWHHRSALPIIIMSSGFVCILVGRMAEAEWLEVTATVSGALIIAISHLVNWKMMHRPKNIRNHEADPSN